MSLPKVFIDFNFKNLSEKDAFVLKTRIASFMNDLLSKYNFTNNISITIGDYNTDDKLVSSKENRNKESLKESVDVRASQYKSMKSLFTFDRLILAPSLKDDLLIAISLIEKEKQIFEDWGLKEIEPFPRTVLNFYGKPGTGKTFAAHAIAHYLNKPILVATYADIESMYHGAGPQNLEAIFYAAERDGAVLFIDEADSLLSKRLKNVTQGSEQAINSMRSQLLICLEKFKGIVIFSTNLVENYDKAFETRVKNIYFPMPDRDSRRELWGVHIPKKLPVSEINLELLSEVDGICGRDIKNSVIAAALKSAFHNQNHVTHDDIAEAINNIKSSKIKEEPIGELNQPKTFSLDEIPSTK